MGGKYYVKGGKWVLSLRGKDQQLAIGREIKSEKGWRNEDELPQFFVLVKERG